MASGLQMSRRESRKGVDDVGSQLAARFWQSLFRCIMESVPLQVGGCWIPSYRWAGTVLAEQAAEPIV
jgi:hypothetical protein